MRTVVILHPALLEGMAEWVALTPGPPSRRREYLDTYLDIIVATLIREEGRVAWAAPTPRFPHTLEWQYSDDLWVTFSVTDRRRWLVRRERVVTLLRVGTRFPDPAAS